MPRMRTWLPLGLLCFSVVAMGLLWMVVGGPWFPRRTAGIRFGDRVRWAGGTVGVYDYCSFPGTYDNQIEWKSPAGAPVRVLMEVGDSVPRLLVLGDGRLQAVYCYFDENKTMYLRARWIAPAADPVVEKFDHDPSM